MKPFQFTSVAYSVVTHAIFSAVERQVSITYGQLSLKHSGQKVHQLINQFWDRKV